jgi:pilus assembly protein Flp/PilA
MGQRLDRGQSMQKRSVKLLQDNCGATAIEYGLIAALVVIGAFTAIKNFSDTTIKMWNNVATTVAKG